MEKSCICQDPVACKGLTAGFALLEDPRSGFVRLPRYEPNPTSDHYVERNARRAAYLRYLLPCHPVEEDTESKHVAMHHFHPRVVTELTPQRRFPKTLTEEDMDKLGMVKQDENKISTVFYIFVPTYPIASAKNDIRRLLGICKAVNTRQKKKHAKHVHQFALDLTNVSSESNMLSGSPTPGAEFLDSESEEENADSVGGKKYLPWHLQEQVHPTPILSQRMAEF